MALRLWIVDDEPLVSIFVGRILRRAGGEFEMESFSDGEQALTRLQALQTASQASWPEIILLDINMPMMDGWMFLDRLPDLKLGQHPLILIHSSSNSEFDLRRAKTYYPAWVQGFITKNIQFAQLEMLAEAHAQFQRGETISFIELLDA